MKQGPPVAWHYTVAPRAAAILADGLIKPAAEGVPAGERSVVWFSTRQHWEPTATKGKLVNGVRLAMTMQEMIDAGLWRFGISTVELLAWRELQRAASITHETVRGLLRAARQVGADPTFWYGALEPVSVERCIIQVFDVQVRMWGGLPASD